MINIHDLFGEIDIYLFDQILKNQFDNQMSILDAGCGTGRNLVYFLRSNYQIFAVDQNVEAILHVREMARKINPQFPVQNFQMAKVEAMPFTEKQFDAVISNAVLHFAENEAHFRQMLMEMWRVLKPKGLLFARLASTIGIEKNVQLIKGRQYHLPDGTNRFLVDEELLIELTEKLDGIFTEPIKTTNVQNLRCMTTWVIRKKS
jgi:tellurite methyltransferase